jgi:hypothetical protein
MPSEQLLTAIGMYNEELVKAGGMLAEEGLQPTSKDARVKFSREKRSVDGHRLLTVRFRPTFSFRFRLFISLLVCLAVCANAAVPQEGTVKGVIEAVVIEVQGTSLTVAGGIVIDISRAAIISNEGIRIAVSIKPGMVIRAGIVGSDDASSTLIAEFVRIQPEDRVVFSGALQSADLDNGHITFLNRRILITDETSFPVGFNRRKLKAGKQFSIIVKPSGADLVATVIFPKLVVPNIFP